MPLDLPLSTLACIREESGKTTNAMTTSHVDASRYDVSGEYSSYYNNYISEKDIEDDSFSNKPIVERKAPDPERAVKPTMTDLSQNTDTANEMEEAELQSQLMTRFRFVLLAGLVAILLLCSVGGYFLARRRNAALFQSEFQSHSEALATAISSRMKEKVDLLESLSASLTSYAVAKESAWPFVTIEDSGLMLSRYLEASSTDAITILPIVIAKKRLLWELYSSRLQGWM